MTRNVIPRLIPGLLTACLLAPAFTAAAAQEKEAVIPNLQRRVERLERLLESQALVDMLRRLDALQQEVQEMRGEHEVRAKAIEDLKQRQRELYLDLDRRLQALESRGAAAGPATAQAPTTPTGAPPQPTAGSAAEQAAYQAAFEQLKQGRYERALEAFQHYLADFPEGQFADNAQYWVGEAYYVTRRFDQALPEFNKVIAQHPDSAKVPDALLKIGYIHYEAKQWKDARDILEALRERYPSTTAASLAAKRLEQMKKEGH
jgi:tol-pal system protein YbgF